MRHALDAWWRCSEPERPTDAFVRWHYDGCAACRIAGAALAQQHPTDPHVAWLVDQLGIGNDR